MGRAKKVDFSTSPHLIYTDTDRGKTYINATMQGDKYNALVRIYDDSSVLVYKGKIHRTNHTGKRAYRDQQREIRLGNVDANDNIVNDILFTAITSAGSFIAGEDGYGFLTFLDEDNKPILWYSETNINDLKYLFPLYKEIDKKWKTGEILNIDINNEVVQLDTFSNIIIKGNIKYSSIFHYLQSMRLTYSKIKDILDGATILELGCKLETIFVGKRYYQNLSNIDEHPREEIIETSMTDTGLKANDIAKYFNYLAKVRKAHVIDNEVIIKVGDNILKLETNTEFDIINVYCADESWCSLFEYFEEFHSTKDEIESMINTGLIIKDRGRNRPLGILFDK